MLIPSFHPLIFSGYVCNLSVREKHLVMNWTWKKRVNKKKIKCINKNISNKINE